MVAAAPNLVAFFMAMLLCKCSDFVSATPHVQAGCHTRIFGFLSIIPGITIM
jgi:hypothetical protein